MTKKKPTKAELKELVESGSNLQPIPKEKKKKKSAKTLTPTIPNKLLNSNEPSPLDNLRTENRLLRDEVIRLTKENNDNKQNSDILEALVFSTLQAKAYSEQLTKTLQQQKAKL